ncbi:hypothetical protein [Lusitaniella coriacea]
MLGGSFFGLGVERHVLSGQSEAQYVFFQGMFCGTATTIIFGTVAEH